MSPRRSVIRLQAGWGWLCIVLGLYPIAIAAGLLPVDTLVVHAPRWLISLCGITFLVGGVAQLAGQNSRVSVACASILLLLMGTIGSWVAVFGPADGFVKGIAVLPGQYNVLLARFVFGFGALLSFVMSFFALRKVIRIGVGNGR